MKLLMVVLKCVLLIILNLSFQINIFSQQSYKQKADSIEALITKAKEADNIQAEKSLLVDLCNVYEYEGLWDLYNITVDKMLSLALENNDIGYVAECNNMLGISNCITGNNIKALEYFTKSLEINIETNDSTGISNSYENMGIVYKDLANYQKAIECQILSLEIRDKIKHLRLLNNYLSIATVCDLMGNYDKQYVYLKKAMQYLDENKSDDYVQYALLYNQYGNYFDNDEDLDSAIVYYNKVIEFSKKAGWQRGIAVGLGNLAETYYSMGDIKKSIEQHWESLKLSIDGNDCVSIAEEYLYLARLFNERGGIDSAFILCTKSLDKTRKCGLGKEELDALLLLSGISEKKGQIPQALDYYKEYHTLFDSLLNIEKQNSVNEIETKYQTEKKEQKIELLSVENKIKNQRIELGIVVISGLLIALVLGVLVMILRRKQAYAQQEELKQKLFRSQMNPHFIFNALGSIQNFMYSNEPKKAARFLGNFASLSRSILQHSAMEIISLDEEIETLKNYIELEKMRFKDSFDYEINIEEIDDVEFIKIPPMMIQPFVENAIKHGFSNKNEGSRLLVRFVEEKNFIKVEVRDNGVGIKQTINKEKEKHKSMATNILSQRMKYIRKKYPHLPNVSIDDISDANETGTKALVFLPIVGD